MEEEKEINIESIFTLYKVLDNRTIMMEPAAGCYTNPELEKNQVRLAYVLCKENLKRALMILDKALEYKNM
ncbi:MAG: hypothetical protein ACI38V_04250 [Bacteroides sp.]